MNTESLQPGQHVQFKLADVHLPAIEEILNHMTGQTELHGTVTLLSDHSDQKTAYAVIEVEGILMPIVVSTSAVRTAQIAGSASMPHLARQV